MSLASRFRAQKPLRTLAVSHSSTLRGYPCKSCQSRVALQATPALCCNSQPYVHTAALPAPLAAKQPLVLPVLFVAPRKLPFKAVCHGLATRDGTTSGAPKDEPQTLQSRPRVLPYKGTQTDTQLSADAIVGRTKHPCRQMTPRAMDKAVALFAVMTMTRRQGRVECCAPS